MAWVLPAIHSFHNWWNGVNKVKAGLKKDDNPLRIGVLSAAAINYAAIIDSVQTHPGVILVGIAARERSKAQAQIDYNWLGPTCKAYGSYEELLAEPNIDAIYIPLPNGLHCQWAIKAMEAGKHVLIEKPLASNAEEVRTLREAATRTNKVALEAFHYRFHPAAHRVKQLIESGEYGDLTSILVRMNVPAGIIRNDNIRVNYELGGGACMDLTYVFGACSYFGATDITKCEVNVIQATARPHSIDGRVDEAIDARFTIEGNGKPALKCYAQGDLSVPNIFGYIPNMSRLSHIVHIELEKATIEFENFVTPCFMHSITITPKDEDRRLLRKKKHTEKCYAGGPQWGTRGEPWWTTWRYQLEAFVDMVRAKERGEEYDGPGMTLDESEKVMELIDAVYDKAGLPRRGI